MGYAFDNHLNGFLRANHGALLPQFDNLRGSATTPQNIKPQVADQDEVGLKTSKSLYDLYLTGFYNLVFQDIRIINGVEQNVVEFGGPRAYGVEFEGAVRPVTGVQLAVRGVYQNGKFVDFGTNSGNDVHRQPQFQIAATPSYTFKSTWGQARLFGTFTHIGDRFADLENQQRLGSYNTVDLGGSLDINDRLSIQATGENTTNTLALTGGDARTVGAANHGEYLLSPGTADLRPLRDGDAGL